eukprot:gnl/TRDRNA2_/TRDRNA2_89979_c0_seq1.p3 gnl/TRDRNA2_/TRDRNA2_89979_c0~~gnl/TRDRNA2_/TRDRNA2_89979_c0_seq1.p3  ORF type:complete len:104 (+),score=4.84 gnl/TRDRNA2_/TRDRNA2_89979_c0_seq1:41-313(+)
MASVQAGALAATRVFNGTQASKPEYKGVIEAPVPDAFASFGRVSPVIRTKWRMVKCVMILDMMGCHSLSEADQFGAAHRAFRHSCPRARR